MTKIAILGDIHFGKLARSKEFCPVGVKLQDNTNGAASIKRGLIDIIKQENVDYLFVAGDLTSTGSPLEYVECHRAVLDIAKESNILEENIIICLGNHDVDWRISDIANTYNELIDDKSIEQVNNYYQKISANIAGLFIDQNKFSEKGPAPFSGIISNECITIFVLNSGWQSNRNEKISHGKIAVEQLSWFKKKALSYKNNNLWKILLLHHHPCIYPYPNPFHDTSFLEEGGEVVQIAGECGFNVICHGHRHHPKAHIDDRNEWQNSMTFICAGSCSVNSTHRNYGDIPNCFHIVELFNIKRIVRLKNYEYSSSEGWKTLTNNRPEAPLDGDMFFYKNYSIETRKKSLVDIVNKAMKTEGCELPAWLDLPLELKTLNYIKLNELIRNVYSYDFQVYGEYPNSVALIRR